MYFVHVSEHIYPIANLFDVPVTSYLMRVVVDSLSGKVPHTECNGVRILLQCPCADVNAYVETVQFMWLIL